MLGDLELVSGTTVMFVHETVGTTVAFIDTVKPVLTGPDEVTLPGSKVVPVEITVPEMVAEEFLLVGNGGGMSMDVDMNTTVLFAPLVNGSTLVDVALPVGKYVRVVVVLVGVPTVAERLAMTEASLPLGAPVVDVAGQSVATVEFPNGGELPGVVDAVPFVLTIVDESVVVSGRLLVCTDSEVNVELAVMIETPDDFELDGETVELKVEG